MAGLKLFLESAWVWLSLGQNLLSNCVYDLFPLSPMCTCLTTINNFGDHLLGCSQGPMRLGRHDDLRLVNTILMPYCRITLVFLRNRKPLMMMGNIVVMFFILTFNMAIRLTSTSPFAVPLSHFYLLICFLCWGGCCYCWRGCQG